MLKKSLKIGLGTLGVLAIIFLCCVSERTIQASWEKDNAIITSRGEVVTLFGYDLYLKQLDVEIAHGSPDNVIRQENQVLTPFGKESRALIPVAESATNLLLLFCNLDKVSKKELVKDDLRNMQDKIHEQVEFAERLDKEFSEALFYVSQDVLDETKTKGLLTRLVDSAFERMFYDVFGQIDIMIDGKQSYILHQPNNDDEYRVYKSDAQIMSRRMYDEILKAYSAEQRLITGKDNYLEVLMALRCFNRCQYIMDESQDLEKLKKMATHGIGYYQKHLSKINQEKFEKLQRKLESINELSLAKEEVKNFARSCKNEVIQLPRIK